MKCYSLTQDMQHMLTNALTSSEILFDALNGAALSGGVKQQQQNGLQDPNHVIEGKSPDQPALSCCTY